MTSFQQEKMDRKHDKLRDHYRN